MHASRINYWNTDKPVCFVFSFVVLVTQQYKQRTASCNPSSHNRKYGEKCTPQRLIIGKPISQYASVLQQYKRKQHEKYHCNPSSHYGKYGEYTCEMRALYIHESHNASTSAMLNSFHNIVSKA